jgi:hypothetical protein
MSKTEMLSCGKTEILVKVILQGLRSKITFYLQRVEYTDLIVLLRDGTPLVKERFAFTERA